MSDDFWALKHELIAFQEDSLKGGRNLHLAKLLRCYADVHKPTVDANERDPVVLDAGEWLTFVANAVQWRMHEIEMTEAEATPKCVRTKTNEAKALAVSAETPVVILQDVAGKDVRAHVLWSVHSQIVSDARTSYLATLTDEEVSIRQDALAQKRLSFPNS